MQYNNTTTKAGIIQMIEQTTNIGDGQISGNATSFAYFSNLVNQWYRICAYFAWKVDKNWSFDDNNQTTFPQATTTIVNNQRDYSIPSTDLRLKQVEVMQSNGDYYTLQYIPEYSDLFNTQKEQEEAGLPTHYRLLGNSLILYPKPDTSVVTATDGLRISTDREVSAFTVSDTTKEPGFAKQFHPILYYGPCLEWSMIKGNVGVEKICTRMLGGFPGLSEMMSDFYSERNQSTINSIQRENKHYY